MWKPNQNDIGPKWGIRVEGAIYIYMYIYIYIAIAIAVALPLDSCHGPVDNGRIQAALSELSAL